MFVAKDLADYRILDTGDGMKLEMWKDIILSRPDPQVVWTKTSPKLWHKANAVYNRSDSGGGEWQYYGDVPERWIFNYKGIRMYVKPTGFKHTGIFPEQSANWDWMIDKIRVSNNDNIKVLNLFGYTGGASLACLKAGASVVHVDSAQSMISWFKENLELSKLEKKSIRYIAEDCLKFVLREQRRGNTYDAIIMDPPSYGRGKGGEVWKMEKDIENLIMECSKILSRNSLFFMLSSYTTGLSSVVMDNLIKRHIVSKHKGKVKSDTLCIPVDNSNMYLPCRDNIKMGKIEVLYEDNHVISVVKPTGILSQGDLSGDMDMLTMIKDYIKKKYDKPGNVFLGLVHRLDRPTGGVMVFAKTSKGASRLCDNIRTGDFKKQYLAVLKGELSGNGTLENYLFKDQRNNMSSVCDKNRKGAKKAILNYEVLCVSDGLSLVKVDLITGRHHQIRVQFSNIGYPLFGERKYSKYTGRGDLALWAYSLTFPHPTKKIPIEVTADLPDLYPYNLFEY